MQHGAAAMPFVIAIIVAVFSALLVPPALAADASSKPWYAGLEGVKVVSPSDNVQQVVDEVFKSQQHAQFSANRFALLFTKGEYKDLKVQIAYYTSVIGVAKDPNEVRLPHVWSLNGDEGGATQNFWRSIEGVTMTDPFVVWAVSQGAPLRRAVVEGDLYLSDNGGWSSGGFMADVRVKGILDMGTQQQWFFRNVGLGSKGVVCPIGWNYVFMGVTGLDAPRCQGSTPGKVVEVRDTPRVAEKPYLVQEEDGHTWNIYVPELRQSSDDTHVRGAFANASAAIDRKLELGKDVFIAKPEHSAAEINKGIHGKKGLLLTPGVYTLDTPVQIKDAGFVVLGIGFPTLIATSSEPAMLVADGVTDVRIAAVLLEAGHPGDPDAAKPLLMWGTRSKDGHDDKTGQVSGVLSDLFARVGSFHYQGCKSVSVETMLEINSNNVIVDDAWLWHADHDDCDYKSDGCYSAHGLVVNGQKVSIYGLSAEHSLGGDIVLWNGEDGETYFYQCELPYHTPHFGKAGYAGYAVSPKVQRHTAKGIGIYIIGKMHVKSAYVGSDSLDLQNLVTVVVGDGPQQFKNSACVRNSDSATEHCLEPEHCDEMRCILSAVSHDNQHDSADAETMDKSTTASPVKAHTTSHKPHMRFTLAVKTSSQLLADSSTGASYSFYVSGKWTEQHELFSNADRSEELTSNITLETWPTKLRMKAKGIDAWGYKRITLTSGERKLTLLDSVDGDLYGANPYWLDNSGGIAPAQQEYIVPEHASAWSIYNHFDVHDGQDMEQMDGTNIEAVKRKVEEGGYSGFTLNLGQAFLKPMGSHVLTKKNLDFMGDTSNAAFFLYKDQRVVTTSRTATSTVTSTRTATTTSATQSSTSTAATSTSIATTTTQASTTTLRVTSTQILTSQPTESLPSIGLRGAGHGDESHGLGDIKRSPSTSISNNKVHPLKVTIVGAKGLVKTDWLGGADPYCVVVLSDVEAREKSKYQTGMQHNTQNPEWNHEHMVTSYTEGDSLEFVVMDKDFWKSTVLGKAALTSSQIFPQGFDGELPMSSVSGEGEEGLGATLKLKVEVLPGSGDGTLSGFIQESGVAVMVGSEASSAGLRLLTGLGAGGGAMLAGVLALSAVAAGALALRARWWQLRPERRGSWEPLVVVE